MSLAVSADEFNQREWVTDVATSTTTGILGGAVLEMLVPELAGAAMHGGIGGLVVGLIQVPLRWLFERRPGGDS